MSFLGIGGRDRKNNVARELNVSDKGDLSIQGKNGEMIDSFTHTGTATPGRNLSLENFHHNSVIFVVKTSGNHSATLQINELDINGNPIGTYQPVETKETQATFVVPVKEHFPSFRYRFTTNTETTFTVKVYDVHTAEHDEQLRSLVEKQSKNKTSYTRIRNGETSVSFNNIDMSEEYTGFYIVVSLKNVVGSPKVNLNIIDRVFIDGTNRNALQYRTEDYNAANDRQIIVHISPDAIYRREYDEELQRSNNTLAYVAIPHRIVDRLLLEVNPVLEDGQSLQYDVHYRYIK